MLDFGSPLDGIRSPLGPRRGGFNPKNLFSSTAIGIWLDPSDVANLTWRRNLLTYSEQFDNAVWTRIQVLAVGVNAAVAPDGTTTADRLTPNTANDARYVAGAPTVSPGFPASMTHSVYVKPDGYGKVAFRENATSGAYASFDAINGTVLATGSAGAVTVSTPTITSVGNGWYRISAVFTASASITQGFSVWLLSPSYTTGAPPALPWVGNGTDGILIWGAQLELGTVATDYQRISDVNTEVIERFPNATMYQDAAGTTPVTTPGQPVGLRLDKSKGLVLGAETVANPGNPFVSTTGYSAGGSATISVDTGRLKVSQTTGFTDGVLCALPNSTFTTTTVVSFDVDLGSSSFVQVQAGNGNFGSGNVITLNIFTSGTHSIKTTTLASGFCGLSFKGASAGDFFLSRVSVKSLAGNHATQATLTARPTYSIEPVGGRRNLLLWTEDLTQSVWEKTSVTALGTVVTISAGGRLSQYFARSSQANYAAKIIASGTGTIVFGIMTGGYATIASQTITLTSTPTAYTIAGSLAGGATLVGLTFTSSAGATATLSATQLELGSTATAYQRVTTQHDVTEAGVASVGYLYFDGVNDAMATSTITPGTDKAQVFAGVRKLTDATTGIVAEFSATTATNSGSFFVAAPIASQAGYRFESKGTAFSFASAALASFVAPITNVLTGLGDISGDTATLRLNGTQVAQATTDQGTGNYLAYPLYLGGRAGTSLFFTGHLYSLVVRFGANLDGTLISNTETWVAGKAGVTL